MPPIFTLNLSGLNMGKFVFSNNRMNMGVAFAVDKCKELNVSSIGVISAPTDDGLSVWEIPDVEVFFYRVENVEEMMTSHDIIVIDENLLTDALTATLLKYVDAVE